MTATPHTPPIEHELRGVLERQRAEGRLGGTTGRISASKLRHLISDVALPVSHAAFLTQEVARRVAPPGLLAGIVRTPRCRFRRHDDRAGAPVEHRSASQGTPHGGSEELAWRAW